jgi:hypothetical protein
MIIENGAYTRILFLKSKMRAWKGIRGSHDAHWDVNELDKVTNETHDSETNGDCFANLCELYNLQY